MWTVVYISQNMETVREIKELLEASEILVMTRTVNDDEGGQGSYELLVPETEVQQAHNIIINYSR